MVAEPDPGSAALRMPTLLVVDDERSLVALLRNYLEAEGFTVLTAYDGPSALDQVRAAQPDLVVLDVMLPGHDGIEVCRQLRRFSDAYVLMLTSKSQEIDKVIGLSVGADDYLTKPFSPASWWRGSRPCCAARGRSMPPRRNPMCPRRCGWAIW